MFAHVRKRVCVFLKSLYSLLMHFATTVNESGLVTSAHSTLIPTTDRELRNLRREFANAGWSVSDVVHKKSGFAVRGTLAAGQTRVDWSLRTRYAPASWEITHSTFTAAGRARKGL